MALHIGIVGPVATAHVAHLLDGAAHGAPSGTPGAPILGTLIEALLARGHRVSAFTLSHGMPLNDGATQVIRGPSFALALCPARPRAWPMNGRRPGHIVDLYAFERRQLGRAIAVAAPEVLHAHWTYEFAWAALRSGRPLVVTCHDSPRLIARFQSDLKHGAYRWLRAGIAWHVLRHARQVTAVSPYLVDQVQALCRVPVEVVPNPMPLRAAAPLTRARRSGLQVAMVASEWAERKNPQAALRAFALLAQHLPDAELHAFGPDFGPGGSAERWWLAQQAPGRVRFHGAVAHDALLQTLAACDVLLHPSLEESFGAVLTEAMAAGLPVVAGAHSGAVPWVVGDGGLLVDVRQPEAMAAAMRRLAAEPAFAAELGRAGRAQSYRRFAAGVVAAAYERRYQAALGLRTPAAAVIA